MKFITVILLSLVALAYCQTPVASDVDTYSSDTIGQGEWSYYSYDLDAITKQSELVFTVFPCSGAIDWYVRKGSLPTKDSYDFRWRFPDGGSHDDIALDTVESYTVDDDNDLNGVYYLGVHAHDHDGDATFQYYAGYVNPRPFPDARGDVQVRERGNGIYRVSWTESNTNNVEYCVYGHHEDEHDHSESELVHGSPCAIEQDEFLGCTTSSFLDVNLAGEDGRWHFDVVVTNKLTSFANAYDGATLDLDGNNSSRNNSSSASTLSGCFMLIAFALIFLN